jgi:predicted transcriptional regulator
VTIQKRGATNKRSLIGAYIDTHERDRLYLLAQAEDRSVSALIRRALRAELARSEERR